MPFDCSHFSQVPFPAMIVRSLLLASCMTLSLHAASETIPLWPDQAPGALGQDDKDKPSLTVHRPAPEKATGASMLIFPGGGYRYLADHEGTGFVPWLVDQGITAIVVKYRVTQDGYQHPAMLNDATRAIRLVRSRAAEWNLDPEKIGVMGSSAGGHLASCVLTHFDAGQADSTDPVEIQSSRPNLGILCYPVITMGEFTHQGSKNGLIGAKAPEELVTLLSSELQVKSDTPPCFIWHTWEDKGVKVENAMSFAQALQAKNIPFEFHVYEKGGHGMGLGKGRGEDGGFHRWTYDCSVWLKERGFAK